MFQLSMKARILLLRSLTKTVAAVDRVSFDDAEPDHQVQPYGRWVEVEGRDAMLQRDLADVAVDREQDGCTDG